MKTSCLQFWIQVKSYYTGVLVNKIFQYYAWEDSIQILRMGIVFKDALTFQLGKLYCDSKQFV